MLILIYIIYYIIYLIHLNILFLFQIGVLLGGEENSTRSQMAAVIEFETRLADITVPQELKRDEEQQYHLLTISELQELAPFVSQT